MSSASVTTISTEFAGLAKKPRSLWSDAARTFSRNKAGMVGLVVSIFVLLIALVAPLIIPYDYAFQDWSHVREGPSAAHWMGTDSLGRDLFSRVVMGVRTAVMVAMIVTFSTAIIGVLVGAMAALIGGWIDSIAVWIMDGLLNFPALWLAAFVTVVTRPAIMRLADTLYKSTNLAFFQDTVVLDYLVVFLCLSFVWWAGLGRLVRGQVLSIREKEFIEAQRAIGASPWWITVRHLVPNVLGQVIVHMSTQFGFAMLAESSLSFLGIGIRPPGASLGYMIFAGMASWRSDPHLVAMPGLTLAFIILAFVFVGDGLNDALNPRIRER
jgi:ABC-type dipeptide/oligopeptide/nickel transport system permease subunit